MLRMKMATAALALLAGLAVLPASAQSFPPVEVVTVQYFGGYGGGYPPGMTPQQILRLGEMQRAYAGQLAYGTARRWDNSLAQSRYFGMTAINGCARYNYRWICP